MEHSPSISTPLPSRINARSLTSQEPSGSFQPYLSASEAQWGNSSREYPAMLPDGPTASPSNIESAFSAEGGDGAPAASFLDGFASWAGRAAFSPPEPPARSFSCGLAHPIMASAKASTAITAMVLVELPALTLSPGPDRRSS